MRAYVMARKGILITDPSVGKMSPSQWMFEYLALAKKERMDREFNVKAMKSVLIHTLGLNLLRAEDSAGNIKPVEEMTEDERETFIPLAIWVGNEGILKSVQEQQEKLETVTGLPKVDDNYERMVAAIDAAEGDIDPIIGIDKLDLPSDPKKLHHERIAGVLSREELEVDGDI